MTSEWGMGDRAYAVFSHWTWQARQTANIFPATPGLAAGGEASSTAPSQNTPAQEQCA